MSENDSVGSADRLLRSSTGLFTISFSLLLLVFVLWITLTSLEYSSSARLFPLIVSVVSLGLLILIVLNNAEDLSNRTLLPDRLQFGQDATAESAPEEVVQQRRATGRILGWIVGVLVLTYLFGMDFALFVFLLAYYRYQAGLGWVRSAIITVGLWLSLVGIFVFVLGVPFPEGVIVELLLG
jgi:hypothetical protein